MSRLSSLFIGTVLFTLPAACTLGLDPKSSQETEDTGHVLDSALDDTQDTGDSDPDDTQDSDPDDTRDTEDSQDSDDTGIDDTSDTGTEPSCTGWFDTVSVMGTSLVVQAELRCTDAEIVSWNMETEGSSLLAGVPRTSSVTIDEVVELAGAGLADGTHILSLSVVASHGDLGVLATEEFVTGTEPTGGVDLVASSLSATPSSAAPGGTFAARVRVANAGSVASPSFMVELYWSTDATWDSGDTVLGSRSGASLASLGVVNVDISSSVPSSAALGGQWILARVDPSDSIDEDDESNNTASASFLVNGPDLVPSRLVVTPSSGAAGAVLSVSVDVDNEGTARAGESNLGVYWSSDEVWDDTDTYLNSGTVRALSAGDGDPMVGDITIPETAVGSGYVLAVMDTEDAVAESDETNNTVSRLVTVVATNPDLAPGTLTATPSSLAPGETLRLSCTLANRGTAASGTVNLAAFLSTDRVFDAADTELDRWTEASIAAGRSFSVSHSFTLADDTPGGTGFVLLVADPDALLTESDETNNTSSDNLVVEQPDLEISYLYSSYSVVDPCDRISITYTARNAGTGSAAASLTGIYLASDSTSDDVDVLLGTDAIGTLWSGGGSEYGYPNVLIPCDTAVGNYHVLVTADHAFSITESDETNNTEGFALRVR